jgi:hypothetical protein
MMKALIERRTRRGWWAYLLWLPAYLILIGLIGADEDPPAWWLLPLSIPLAVTLVQWIYPTILGWAAISIPTLLYAGQLLYLTVRYEGVEADTTGTVLNWVFFGYLAPVCAVLVLARPKFSDRLKPKAGICEQCGYDLRATPDRCPECGTVVSPHREAIT